MSAAVTERSDPISATPAYNEVMDKKYHSGDR
jgi:hypothetical protein